MDVLPVLTAEEVRVLGSLIEKSKTTPDYYPMTINALTAACNQKSSRHPIVEYDEETVTRAVQSLKAQSLVSTAVGGGSRVIKYKHNFTTVFPVSDAELAVLCLLFLRGPLTPGEINSNSGRLHQFSSLESVLNVIDKLKSSEPPFVTELAKRPGQKERRFAQLMSGQPSVESEDSFMPVKENDRQLLEDRVSRLEQELAEVKQVLEQIRKELF